MGHQEIMGTKPKKPLVQPFQEKVDEIAQHLKDKGHKVEVRSNSGLRYLLVDDYCTVADNIDADFGMAYNCTAPLDYLSFEKELEIGSSNSGLRYLLVDDYCTVADNIDADFGMAYNCTAPLDYLSFEKELEIGRCVREVATVNRVIPFGGTGTTLEDILNAEETRLDKFIGIHAVKSKSYEQGYQCRHLGYGVNKDEQAPTIPFGGTGTTLEDILNAEETRLDKFIGIHAVKSKSYEQGYQCRHLGYGVNKDEQAPTILTKAKVPVSLFGKVADIVANDDGKSVSCVDTGEVLDLTIEEMKKMDYGFICTNVQETDLAGHSQNAAWYKDLLVIADEKIGKMLELLEDEDVLLVMADHGNDPDIGHNRHTRENVPLLLLVIADEKIGKMLELLEDEDVLLVMADHGNDPDIGHNRHTRENVPLLIKKEGVEGIELSLRKSLSDVGASVCDYFGVAAPANGKSFMELLK